MKKNLKSWLLRNSLWSMLLPKNKKTRNKQVHLLLKMSIPIINKMILKKRARKKRINRSNSNLNKISTRKKNTWKEKSRNGVKLLWESPTLCRKSSLSIRLSFTIWEERKWSMPVSSRGELWGIYSSLFQKTDDLYDCNILLLLLFEMSLKRIIPISFTTIDCGKKVKEYYLLYSVLKGNSSGNFVHTRKNIH